MTLASLIVLTLLGCVADVGEGKVAAVVTEAPAPEPAKAAPAGKVLKIDAATSHVNALGAKITAQHPIVFGRFEGAVTVDGDAVTDLNFTVDVDSIDAVGTPKLTGHLKKEDFLWVDKYPTASFDASEIKAGSDVEGSTHTVTGALEIRGVTKQVSFPAKISVEPGLIKASTEFSINRQDFAVTYRGKADDLVQDNVLLTIDFNAAR